MEPPKEKGAAENVHPQVVFIIYQNSTPSQAIHEPFAALRRAYLALEADQDDDQRRIALLKAQMAYRRSIRQAGRR